MNKVFQNEPVIAFKCNKNLKELIGSNKIENNIVKRINKSTLKPGKCFSSFGNSKTPCCNQVITTLTFKSQQNLEKVDTRFNIRLNNHRNDVKNPHPKTILASKHLQEESHNFNKHKKFIIIEKLANTKKPKEILRQRLIERGNFWIQTLEDTIHSIDLNQELSK